MKRLLVRSVLALMDVSFAPPHSTATADAPANDCLVKGRFGMAFDAATAVAQTTVPFKQIPMTVELWCKLNSSDEFNILVSCKPKESADHGEVFTEVGSGTFSAYLPGMTPQVTRSRAVITDGGRCRESLERDVGLIVRPF